MFPLDGVVLVDQEYLKDRKGKKIHTQGQFYLFIFIFIDDDFEQPRKGTFQKNRISWKKFKYFCQSFQEVKLLFHID